MISGQHVFGPPAISAPTWVQQKLLAEEHGSFSYAGSDTGPSAWPGTCSIGDKQSPINIPLAEHFAQSDQETNNGQRQKIGDIKIQYSQKQDEIGELGFDFQQELNDTGDFKFDFEQKVEKFGDIKFHFQLKFQQTPNRFGDISFQYNSQVGAVVKNTGHGTMQVNAPQGNTAQVSGRDLELVQWHFHTPSEHAFDGVRKAMEAHLVHKDTKTGGLAVVAVLLEEGPSPPNPALQFALSLAPEASHEQQTDQQPMQLESLLPQQEASGHRPYIHYVGSLTTPPCSEDVQWFVFADTVTVPGSQVDQFQQYADKANPGLRANARPLQPVNNRTVDYAGFL
ncbi:hypothetical protein WJX77_005738 [Trebouxia sp. C0004]